MFQYTWFLAFVFKFRVIIEFYSQLFLEFSLIHLMHLFGALSSLYHAVLFYTLRRGWYDLFSLSMSICPISKILGSLNQCVCLHDYKYLMLYF